MKFDVTEKKYNVLETVDMEPNSLDGAMYDVTRWIRVAYDSFNLKLRKTKKKLLGDNLKFET